MNINRMFVYFKSYQFSDFSLSLIIRGFSISRFSSCEQPFVCALLFTTFDPLLDRCGTCGKGKISYI